MNTYWPSWKILVFGFCFIYFMVLISPWTWLDFIPYVSEITKYAYVVMDWMVQKSNKYIFHVRPVLVEVNGSGDTSWAWTQLWMMTCISIIGSVIWYMIARTKTNYIELKYLLNLFIRYYVAIVLLGYGLIKVFLLQMWFPSESQLATPLGDFLPMRFSWLFIGYSEPYQIFSGAAETIAGLLLLWRRTATLGTLIGGGVFANVVALNLSYDIPVKLYSIHLFVLCIFLLFQERDRIYHFFIAKRVAAPSNLYDHAYIGKWKYVRWILKGLIILSSIVLTIPQNIESIKDKYTPETGTIIPNGHYEIAEMTKNNVPVLFSNLDTMQWRNIIIDGKRGSVNTSDTLFGKKRYNRAYFSYAVDSSQNLFKIRRQGQDTAYFARFKFEQPDSVTIKLQGVLRQDSVKMTWKKIPRHFQLAERQFHWLSEYNR